MNKVYLAIVAVIAILILIFYLLFDFNTELEEKEDLIELFSEANTENKLFIINKYRGLDYQKSYLSLNKNADKNNSYVYDSYPIFIDKKLDTVFVYTYKKAIKPIKFESNIKIKQIELNNKSMMNLYDTYASKGLILIE